MKCEPCKLRTARANYLRKDAAHAARRAPGRKPSVVIGRRGTILEYFMAKVEKRGDCHVWIGALTNNGYPVFVTGHLHNPARSSRAHRWAYEQWRGSIPSGMQLDHLCNNRACVNPSHLEPVTALENNRRAFARRELIAA